MKGITKSFFSVPPSDTNIQIGDLLVSEPFLKDKWFERSVVSVIDRDANEGTTGLILNLQLATTLSDVFNEVDIKDVPVFCGGPLGHDRLLYLHTLGEEVIPDARQICPGLWLGGRFDSALEYINSGYPYDGAIRFFIGYSGWTVGQLEKEMKENSWVTGKCPHDTSFLLSGAGSTYWHKIVRNLGDDFRSWQIMPGDIRAN